MRLLSALALTCIIGHGAARADVAEVVDTFLLPAVAKFSEASAALAETALRDCSIETVLPAYHAARDAWIPLADMRIGPGEAGALTINFWPDQRGNGARVIVGMLTDPGPALHDPVEFGRLASAAARGFPGLDLMLGDGTFDYITGEPGCALVQMMAVDLATQARTLAENWQGFAPGLVDPGTGGDVTYLDLQEVRAALYTQIITGLTLTTDQRLGRPLGTFDQPRPTRAEAWRTDRALPDALGSAEAAATMAQLLAGQPLIQTERALAAVRVAAAAIQDPSFADIDNPNARLRVEILQQRITALRLAIETEIPALYGVSTGFNAADGD